MIGAVVDGSDDTVGGSVGFNVGEIDGSPLCSLDGSKDGALEGLELGSPLDAEDGSTDGSALGVNNISLVGLILCFEDGVYDDVVLGLDVGTLFDNIDGLPDGCCDGVDEGINDTYSSHASHANGQASCTICPLFSVPQ